jgi:hypothetical protein
MLCHAAALTGPNLVQAGAAPSTCAVCERGCRCCSGGGAKMATCPMARAQSGGACRLRCGPKDQSVPLLGPPGVPLPAFVTSVSLACETLSNRARSCFPDVILPVPDQPPRQTVSPR